MRVIRAVAALLLAASLPRPASAARVQQPSDASRAIGDLEHYHGMVVFYRAGDDGVLTELLAWEEDRLRSPLVLINSSKDPYRPRLDGFLRSAALIHTAAALELGGPGASNRTFFQVQMAANR